MRLAALVLLTVGATACGGQTASPPESTGVWTVGSVGDGPADGGSASDADGASDGGDATD